MVFRQFFAWKIDAVVFPFVFIFCGSSRRQCGFWLLSLVFHICFLCSLRGVVLMYQRCRQRSGVVFLFFFLTPVISLHHLLDVRTNSSSLVFLFSRPFFKVLQETSWVSYKEDSPGDYPFDEIPVAEFVFKKFSCLFVILSIIFPSPHVRWYLLTIFPSTWSFPFLPTSVFCLNLLVLFLPL